jgi:hypothetical protein
MDLTLNLELTQQFFLFLLVLGFLSLSCLVYLVSYSCWHYMKYKTFATSTKDRYIFDLLKKNKDLNQRVVFLQTQIDEITQNLIKNLQ